MKARTLEQAFEQHVIRRSQGSIGCRSYGGCVGGCTCWTWTGPLSSGCPQLCYQATIIRAARFSYELVHGPVVGKVRGMCGNRLCVNPGHLRVGDASPEELYQRAVRRFWESVARRPAPECWIWTGPTKGPSAQFQYGHVFVNGRGDVPSHRFSYELNKGPIPDGQWVCHTCDVPRCVNPEHLFLGTVQSNTQDMVNKGRQQKGEAHYKSTATIKDVKKIRELWAARVLTQLQIAQAMGLGLSVVKHIIRGRSWTHVP